MIAIKDRHRDILLKTIEKYFTFPVEVWAYGSRIDGTSHDSSDLDLVVRSKDLSRINWEIMLGFISQLKEDNIPFIIQAWDWATLPENFHRQIEKKHEVLWSGIA